MVLRTKLSRYPITLPVTQKGQVTIPAAMRHSLGIESPGHVTAFLGDDGDVHLRPLEPIENWRGKYKPLPGREHVSFEQMADDAMQDLADETMREMSEP